MSTTERTYNISSNGLLARRAPQAGAADFLAENRVIQANDLHNHHDHVVTIIGLKAEDRLRGVDSLGDYGIPLVGVEAIPATIIGDKVKGCIIRVDRHGSIK